MTGSGEILSQELSSQEDHSVWIESYAQASVMIFCLPLWTAFPKADLADSDWELRARIVESFEQVVMNYETVRSEVHKPRNPPPVRAILALTMADDPRTSLETLRSKWIKPYLDLSSSFLQQLRTSRGVAKYLANARRVSAVIAREFLSADADDFTTRNPRVTGLFGWLALVRSAVCCRGRDARAHS